MTNCLVKSIVLYIVVITILHIIKPQIFYYDNEKTELKSWDLYKHTNNNEDLVNIYSSAIFISICSYFMIYNL
jgi:hypothetical protein